MRRPEQMPGKKRWQMDLNNLHRLVGHFQPLYIEQEQLGTQIMQGSAAIGKDFKNQRLPSPFYHFWISFQRFTLIGKIKT